MHEIDNTTRITFYEDKMILEFSNSIERKIFYGVGAVFCFLGFLFAIYACLLQGGIIEGIAMIMIFTGILFFFIQEIALKEVSEIDFKKRTCLAKSYFFHRCQETVLFIFPDNFTFYYLNMHDAEDNHVIDVFLIVSDIEKKKSDQKIINFRDETTFIKFYTLFSQHFSEYKTRQFSE